MNHTVPMHRKHVLLNEICSSRHGIILYEVPIKASSEVSKIAQDIVISLGFPP